VSFPSQSTDIQASFALHRVNDDDSDAPPHQPPPPYTLPMTFQSKMKKNGKKMKKNVYRVEHCTGVTGSPRNGVKRKPKTPRSFFVCWEKLKYRDWGELAVLGLWGFQRRFGGFQSMKLHESNNFLGIIGFVSYREGIMRLLFCSSPT
jgi:hypothetical protein